MQAEEGSPIDPNNDLFSAGPWKPTFGRMERGGQVYWLMTIHTPSTSLTVVATKEQAEMFAEQAKQSTMLASQLIIPATADGLLDQFKNPGGQQ